MSTDKLNGKGRMVICCYANCKHESVNGACQRPDITLVSEGLCASFESIEDTKKQKHSRDTARDYGREKERQIDA